MRRQDKNKMLYMCVVCVCDYRDILMMYLGETTPRPRGDRTKKKKTNHTSYHKLFMGETTARDRRGDAHVFWRHESTPFCGYYIYIY